MRDKKPLEAMRARNDDRLLEIARLRETLVAELGRLEAAEVLLAAALAGGYLELQEPRL